MNIPFTHIQSTLQPYSKKIFFALTLIFLHTLAGFLLIFFSRKVQRDSFPVYIIFIFSFHQVFSIFDDWILSGLSHAWTRDTRRNILQQYIHKKMTITGNSQHDWNEIQKEIYWLGESIFSFFRGTFRRVLQIAVFSAFLLYLSPALFLYCFIFFLLLLLFGFLHGRIINSIRSRYIDTESRLSVFELEAARYRDIIEIHGKGSFMEKIHASFLDKSMKNAMLFDRIRMTHHPIQVILFLITVAFIFYTGNNWVQQGSLSPRDFHSFLAGLSLLYTPLSGISSDVGAFLSLQRMKNLSFILQRSDIPECSSIRNLVSLSRISMKNVSFSYDSTPLFVRMNLEITDPIAGFRGSNGSGKTTLALLLARILHPREGSIRFLDNQNEERSDIAISYIDQNGSVFSLSLADNLFLSRLGELHFLQHFHELTEKESVGPEIISAGQKKAVSIERALQHPCSLLIIDEPENALDSEKKQILREILLEKSQKGVRIILFSHDDFFLKICSKVVDMQTLRN